MPKTGWAQLLCAVALRGNGHSLTITPALRL